MEQRIIECDFNNNNDLYAAYMPFLTRGGLFISIRDKFVLGEEVVLDLHLMDEPDRHEITGEVVWITPEGAQGGKPCGIGVHFSEDKGSNIRTKIETYLAGMLQSSSPTLTI